MSIFRNLSQPGTLSVLVLKSLSYKVVGKYGELQLQQIWKKNKEEKVGVWSATKEIPNK